MSNTTVITAPKKPKHSAIRSHSTIRSLSVEEINAVSGAGSSAKIYSACCSGKHFDDATIV